MAYVLINHGWGNVRPTDHWQRQLAVALRRQGHQVFYPQYPNTEEPDFVSWSNLLLAELDILLQTRGADQGEVVVIGHSLGNVLWLKAATDGLLPAGFEVDRLLMVAPPERAGISVLPSFDIAADDARIAAAMRATAKNVTLVGSDNDPWSPSGIQAGVANRLGLQAVIIAGAAHLSHKDGWGQWQGVIDWVNDPKADIMQR